MKVSAVFDIGKTNKKFFLFDKSYREIHKDYIQFEQIKDEDGDECENLSLIEEWMGNTFGKALNQSQYDIQSLNFSSYGASFVHIGDDGKPVAPLYNYLKPLPDRVLESFTQKYGDLMKISQETASPALGLLNSGLQLFWLKHEKPEIYSKIKWSLHLPQYLSYLFTGEIVSEYTSIGCHTMLWNFDDQDYHEWVYKEHINLILPPVVRTDKRINKDFSGKKIMVGVGIHDSSSALLPYIRADRHPFLLVSTGTWSISLNSFSKSALTKEDLSNDCLNFMRTDGSPVRACRLFLGKEYTIQLRYIHHHFGLEYGHHRGVVLDLNIYNQLRSNFNHCFKFEYLPKRHFEPSETDLDQFNEFAVALHQLIMELVELQVECVERAIGDSEIEKIYIDGGFADNDLYVRMLADYFKGYKIRTTRSPVGSALGASIVISKQELTKKFLKQKYAMRKLPKH